MIKFHADFGGLCYWILIKCCRTKLSDEQSPENKRRNLFFLSFLNIIFALIVTMFVIYPI